jgi:hypothetical protein
MFIDYPTNINYVRDYKHIFISFYPTNIFLFCPAQWHYDRPWNGGKQHLMFLHWPGTQFSPEDPEFERRTMPKLLGSPNLGRAGEKTIGTAGEI